MTWSAFLQCNETGQRFRNFRHEEAVFVVDLHEFCMSHAVELFESLQVRQAEIADLQVSIFLAPLEGVCTGGLDTPVMDKDGNFTKWNPRVRNKGPILPLGLGSDLITVPAVFFSFLFCLFTFLIYLGR